MSETGTDVEMNQMRNIRESSSLKKKKVCPAYITNYCPVKGEGKDGLILGPPQGQIRLRKTLKERKGAFLWKWKAT